MATITLAINGKTIACRSGISVLEAARQNGITIPTLCHHDDLAPHGGCRICLVEDEKSGRLMAACVTPVAQGAQLLTHSAAVLRHRRNIVRLMIAEHPESCIVCDKGNRCRLRGIAAELGVGETKLYPMPNYKPLEQANPFITRDLSKCILCGKCIRADHELVGVGAIDYHLRGFRSRPCTLNDQPLEGSECTFCGTCVSMCPTGALNPAGARFVGTPERTALSVCGFCAVGCALSMGVAAERVVAVNPASQPDTVNGATLCVRGHFAHDFLNSTGRLTRPLIRRGGNLEPASWDEALAQVAETLLTLKKEHGSGSLGFWGSPTCTNEENYLFQKIARAILGTPNIDNSGCWTGRSHWQLLNEHTGGGCRRQPLADLERAGAILVLGADPSQSLPVMSYHIKRALRKGIPLITAATVPTELDRSAAMAMALPPQRHGAFLWALCARMLRIEAVDSAYIADNTEGFDGFRQALQAFDVSAMVRDSGLSWDKVVAAADLLQGRRIAAIIGHEVIYQEGGLACVNLLVNLLLMTGSLGAPGAGVYVESQANNLLGAWDMGSGPDTLPGGTVIGDPHGRREWEKTWHCRLSPDSGLSMNQMIEAAETDRLKGLYILGENPLRALPGRDRIKTALGRVEFIVVQDIVHHETVDIAHVVLPGTPFAEKAGSFTNLEGRIQSFAPVVPPLEQSRPDLDILAALAARMEGARTHPGLEGIRSEIRQQVPLYAGLGSSGRQGWVRPQPLKRAFDPQGQAGALAFVPVEALEPFPVAAESYPYAAVLAFSRFHAGAGTRTGLSPRIQKSGPNGAIRISPQDCRQLDIAAGSRVRVTSHHGVLERETVLDAQLSPGTIVIPLAFNANDARQLAAPPAPGRDCTALSSSGAVLRVNVEKLS